MESYLTAHEKTRAYYLIIAIGCAMFILLTFIAMLTFAGGTATDPSSHGYSFTHNFFSELGFTVTSSGRSNLVSATLFFLSLGSAGICLMLFFVLFRRFFQSSRLQKSFSVAGSILGILAGISFVGIAFTPANLARPAHIQFVMWAFRLFPLAVLCYLPAIFTEKSYPKVYAWVFTVFCLMLIGYYLLMVMGPRATTPEGLVVQVVGQKVISYASILCIGIQSLGAYRYLDKVIRA